jgi:NADH-quinone oxidoreductase subunit E
MPGIEDILSKYSGRDDLIEVLSDVQDQFGFISEDNMRRIQEALKIPLVEIYGVVTFYSGFKLKPSGKHIIRVCTGTACHVKRGDIIHSYLRDKLGVSDGETTRDGKFTLEAVNCLGACAYAPALMIDDEVFGNLTRDKVDEVLGRY